MTAPDKGPRVTPTMKLIDERLQAREGVDLPTFIRRIRAGEAPAAPNENTWDDVAYHVRAVTGVRAVRESAINWARRYGIDPYRADDAEQPADAEPAQV